MLLDAVRGRAALLVEVLAVALWWSRAAWLRPTGTLVLATRRLMWAY